MDWFTVMVAEPPMAAISWELPRACTLWLILAAVAEPAFNWLSASIETAAVFWVRFPVRSA